MITPFGTVPDRLVQGATMADLYELLNRSTSRRTMLRAGAGLGMAALTPALWTQSARASSTAVYGKRLAYGPDAKTSMIVAFAISGPFSSAAVRVKDSYGADFTTMAAITTVSGSNNHYAHASISGLRPDTSYTYTVLLDGAPATTSNLRTAPSGAIPFRFTAFGDQGTGVQARNLLKRVKALDPRLHLFAGDLCYADSSGRGRPADHYNPNRWDEWLVLNGPVTKSLPWMCAVGNHEMEPGFGPQGYAGVIARVPVGGASPLAVPVASVFRVANTAFLSLDSNDVSYEIPANRGWTHGAQTAWLHATLATLRAAHSEVDFIVAYMHHSPYCTNTAHGSEGGVRDEWVPLFDKYEVDLVVSGHNHCYERTVPLRAGKMTVPATPRIDSRRGTTYITAGGGGQLASPNFTTNGTTRVSLVDGHQPEMARWSVSDKTSEHLVLCADVSPATGANPAQMHLRAIGDGGDVRDEITLVRGKRTATGSGSTRSDWLLGGGGLVAVGAIGVGAVALRRPRPPNPPGDPAPSARLPPSGV